MSKLPHLLGLLFGFLMLSASYAAAVNVNSASAEEIAASLQGIGLNQAAAIVAYREQNGPFTSPDELTQVKGIGAKTVAKNKADILLTDAKKASSTAKTKKSKTTTAPSSQQPININTATKDELVTLVDIGPKKAEAILKYREEMGLFKTIDDFLNVNGIGPKTLEKNRALIRIN